MEDPYFDALAFYLQHLDSVTLQLLNECMAMPDVRVLFDATREKHENNAKTLSDTVAIVTQPHFVKAFVLLQENCLINLSLGEESAFLVLNWRDGGH